MQLKFSSFFLIISRSFFYRKPSGRPLSKRNKIKRWAKKPSTKRPYVIKIYKSGYTFLALLLIGQVLFPFFLKLPALLVTKLVCL